MSDLEIIQQIENQFKVKLRQIDFEKIQEFQEIATNHFATDEEGIVIGLKLNGIQTIDLSLIAKLGNLKRLELSNSLLEDLAGLKNLNHLTELILTRDNIKDISSICELKSLEALALDENQIESIVSVSGLRKLAYLSLENNKITDIAALKELNNLRVLVLEGNQIKDISPLKTLYLSGINPVVDNNPLKYPPTEIVELGKGAIIEYFEQCEKGTSVLQEAKLIVIGEAGAGKTTFTRRIQNAEAEMPKPDETTLGINVSNWNFGGDYDTRSLNAGYYTQIWDFGGQDIYHGTHQFFFSDKSLYVLLADTREQKTDFNYWLNTVEQITGENSPLVILLNRKQKHFYQIDEPGLKNRFGSIIRKVLDFDLSNTSEIPKLQNIVQHEILNLPQIDYILPTAWVEIRQKLNKRSEKFISFASFRDICKNSGVKNPKVVKIISKLFTNIGVFTHFADEFSSLQDIIFLDSDWLTKTVYLLLNNEIVKTKQGRITIDEISEIWKADEIYFEKNKFIELLKKFSLIYRINGSNKYIVPEYLPMVQPYGQWKYANEDGIYQFRYLFDNYMPKGIMPKLIVALHQYIYDNHWVWHRGVNITNSLTNPDTYAEIIETYGRENRFDIRIHGKNHKDLLNIIIYHFDNMLKRFKKLTHEKLVPCNCDTCKTSNNPHFFSYAELNERKEENKKTIECRKKPYLDVDIDSLIYGISFTELRSLLLNGKFEEFKKAINQRFSDISYQIHKEQVSESFFHGIFHTILAENGLNPVSEESTNEGRIDMHLTIGETKYLFEFKIDKTADDALNQIREKEYYRKFQRGFSKLVLVGINFNSNKRNIQEIKTMKIN